MKNLFMIALLVLLVSCQVQGSPDDPNTVNPAYAQDPRTKLCFALTLSGGAESYAVSNVPCAPEVCKLIGKCE